jgi:hypothetical protein
MEKTHCECCDVVIGQKVKHLMIKIAVSGIDGTFEEDSEFRDYCLRCAKQQADKILQGILAEWEEELKA